MHAHTINWLTKMRELTNEQLALREAEIEDLKLAIKGKEKHAEKLRTIIRDINTILAST